MKKKMKKKVEAHPSHYIYEDRCSYNYSPEEKGKKKKSSISSRQLYCAISCLISLFFVFQFFSPSFFSVK